MESKGFSDIFRTNLKGSEREKSELFRTKRDKDIFDVSIYLTLSLSLSTHET